MYEGDSVDDFTALDQQGEEVTLSRLLESGPVVLYFFPKAMTAGCTKESCHFRNLSAEFGLLGAQIVGMSADPVDRQLEFAEAHSLGFPLLSDPDFSIAREFAVRRLGPLPSKRATFVIDTDRRVLGVIESEVNMNAHADQALAILRARS